MELNFNNNPHSLFRKYWQLTTWFSNTQLGRDFLKQDNFYIPNEKISLLLPNGYHIQKDKTLFQAVITTRACYAPKIFRALKIIDLVLPWLNNFDEAKYTFLGSLDLIPWIQIPRVARNLHFTTTAFNPDAHPETTTTDGTAERSTPGGETFASLIGGAGSTGGDSGSTDNMPFFISDVATDNYTENKVGFFLYDTSTIPDTDQIISGTKQIFTGVTSTNELSQSVSLGKCTPATNTAIVAADYSQRVKTRQASDLSFPGANASYTFTLNATGLASISKTGITKFSVMISADMNSAAPSWIASKTVQLTTVFSDNGSNKPVLTLTYNALSPRIVNFN